MKLFVMLYLAAGALLSFLGLRLFHGNFADWQGIAAWTAGLNAITLLFVYLLFRPEKPQDTGALVAAEAVDVVIDQEEDRFGDQVVFVLSYAVGLGSGAYFYFT